MSKADVAEFYITEEGEKVLRDRTDFNAGQQGLGDFT